MGGGGGRAGEGWRTEGGGSGVVGLRGGLLISFNHPFDGFLFTRFCNPSIHNGVHFGAFEEDASHICQKARKFGLQGGHDPLRSVQVIALGNRAGHVVTR